jgi:hypothetical protein
MLLLQTIFYDHQNLRPIRLLLLQLLQQPRH